MFLGVALLAMAYATILGTIVVILRIDNSRIEETVWQRLRLILTAWLFDAHPEVYRARYAVILTMSSSLLYWIAYWVDVRIQVAFNTSGYLLVSRLAIMVGEIFAFSGMGYCLIYTFDAMRKRAPIRLLVFSFLFLVSFSLLFLHLFAFISQWPPVVAWIS